MVSVIIPTHNRAQLLKRALASLIPFVDKIQEVIVCNDRSTDDTIPVVISFNTILPIKLINIQSGPHTPGYVRQFGIDAASAEWLFCLDDDDAIFPIGFSQAIEELDNLDEQYVGLACSYLEVDGNKLQIKSAYGSLNCNSHFINKKFLLENNLRFNEEITNGEDTAFFIEMTILMKNQNKSILIIDDYILTVYIRHEDSLTRTNFQNLDNQYKSIFIFTKFVIQDILKRGITKDDNGYIWFVNYVLQMTVRNYIAYLYYGYKNIECPQETLDSILEYREYIRNNFNFKLFKITEEEILEETEIFILLKIPEEDREKFLSISFYDYLDKKI